MVLLSHSAGSRHQCPSPPLHQHCALWLSIAYLHLLHLLHLDLDLLRTMLVPCRVVPKLIEPPSNIARLSVVRAHRLAEDLKDLRPQRLTQAANASQAVAGAAASGLALSGELLSHCGFLIVVDGGRAAVAAAFCVRSEQPHLAHAKGFAEHKRRLVVQVPAHAECGPAKQKTVLRDTASYKVCWL